jgi:hypothetical protein
MSTQLIHVVTQIVEAAGQDDAFRTAEHFHLRVPNPPYMDLVIESWNSGDVALPCRRISVVHYFEQNGDLVADPEVEITDSGFPIELTQVLGYTQVAHFVDGEMRFNPRTANDVNRFLNLWVRNLKAQGFIKAAGRIWHEACDGTP